MKDYPKMWAEKLLAARSIQLPQAMSVIGERDAHLGPRLEFARVQILAEPATHFEVIDATQPSEEIGNLGYPDSFILGILDVLMVALPLPSTGIRVVLKKAEYDPISSSPMAFRQAGRDAGRKIIESSFGVPKSGFAPQQEPNNRN